MAKESWSQQESWEYSRRPGCMLRAGAHADTIPLLSDMVFFARVSRDSLVIAFGCAPRRSRIPGLNYWVRLVRGAKGVAKRKIVPEGESLAQL